MSSSLRILLSVAVLAALAGGLAPGLFGDRGQTRAQPGEAPSENVAPDTTDASTRAAFSDILSRAQAEGWQALPFGVIVQRVGETLVGRAYEAGLLDRHPEETLVADLTAFDCVLYIENVLALAEGVATADTTYAGYLDRLERLRYREGTMSGYCSRLHYFTEWIANNAERGALRNVTAEMGGQPFEKEITFMSEHRSSYPRLASSDSLYACIVDMEAGLRRAELVVLPQERIHEAYARIQHGDVVAMATRIGGLDVTHTGFAYRFPDGGIGFLHASSADEAVKISPDLQGYVQSIDSQIGVMIARPTDPRRAAGDGSLSP